MYFLKIRKYTEIFLWNESLFISYCMSCLPWRLHVIHLNTFFVFVEFKRSITSAPDTRFSSKTIGLVGAVCIALVVGFIVAVDYINICQKCSKPNTVKAKNDDCKNDDNNKNKTVTTGLWNWYKYSQTKVEKYLLEVFFVKWMYHYCWPPIMIKE